MRYAPQAKRTPSSSTPCTATANNAARVLGFQKNTETSYIPLKTKLISLVWFAPIVIVCVDVSSFSCQASRVKCLPANCSGQSCLFCFRFHCRTLPTHGHGGASTGTPAYFTDSVRRGF